MKSDPHRPSTWRKYKEGMCNDCFALCCTQEVEVDLEDLKRLNLIASDEDEYLSLKEIFKNLKNQGVVKKWDNQSKFTLSQYSNGACYFLGADRKCTVYDKRPKTCKNYPFPSSRPGFCPYQKKK